MPDEPPGSNGTPKREVGHPKHSSPAVGQKELHQIERWYLQGVTISDIARRLDVFRQTVTHHLNKTIRPKWRAEQGILAAEELAKIRLIETVAWEKFMESQEPQKRKVIREVLGKEGIPERLREWATSQRTGETVWLDIVKWAVEFRCKLAGLLIDRREIRQEVGIRVAGLRPEELTAAIFGEIVQRVEDRRAERLALEDLSDEGG